MDNLPFFTLNSKNSSIDLGQVLEQDIALPQREAKTDKLGRMGELWAFIRVDIHASMYICIYSKQGLSDSTVLWLCTCCFGLQL